VKYDRAYPIEISTELYPEINSDMQLLFTVYGAMNKLLGGSTNIIFILRHPALCF
jgi:hypothetical protein